MSDCDRIRAAIQERLDGTLAGGDDLAIRGHLAGCPACREFESGLRRVQDALRALPPTPMPDEVLDAVWDRTVRARERRRELPALHFGWKLAVAAVLLAVALLAVFFRYSPPPAPRRAPDPAEIARADRDARRVLLLVSQAFHSAERAAADQVLAGEVSPTIRRIPIISPAATPLRRSRT